MITSETIGALSLNISFILYLVLFFPQLLHNLIYKKTKNLSLLMHSILVLANCADLIYGFGRHMQWQYRTVTIVALACLVIQGIQICTYSRFDKRLFKTNLATIIFLNLIVLYAIYSVWMENLTVTTMITIGAIAHLGFITYSIPQIIKNYRLRTTSGISIYFVGLSIFLGICDTVSAWALQWDLPSKIGSPIMVMLGMILFSQFFTLRKKTPIHSPDMGFASNRSI